MAIPVGLMLLALAAAVTVVLVARLRAESRRHRELSDLGREYQDAVDTARQQLFNIRRDRGTRN